MVINASLSLGSGPVEGTGQERAAATESTVIARDEAHFLRAHRSLTSARNHHSHDRHGEAAADALEAARHFGQAGMDLAQGRILRLAADCLLAAGQPVQALATVDEAAVTFSELDEDQRADLAGCEATRGEAERRRGDLDAARRHLAEASDLFAATGMARRAMICRLNQAVVMHAEGAVSDSVDLLTDLRLVLLKTRRADAVAVCDFNLGVAHHDLGHLDDAVEYLQQARAVFGSLGRSHDVAACNQNLGVALQAMDRHDEALQRLREARAGFSTLGRIRDAAQCDHNLAVVVRSLGDHVDADRLEAQARAAEASEREPT